MALDADASRMLIVLIRGMAQAATSTSAAAGSSNTLCTPLILPLPGWTHLLAAQVEVAAAAEGSAWAGAIYPHGARAHGGAGAQGSRISHIHANSGAIREGWVLRGGLIAQ